MQSRSTGRPSLSLFAAVALAGGLGATAASSAAQDGAAQEDASARCTVDLGHPGIMKDIASNALVRGLGVPEPEVAAFLAQAESTYATGDALLKAAASRFHLDEAILSAAVARFEHCNCSHGPSSGESARAPAPDPEALQFARDVTLHVVLHEMAHALVREFDLPVLGNEETMADAFATHYLTTYLPERARRVVEARVRSLWIEARAVPRDQWPVGGEHDGDARRAFQITALALAADAEGFAPLAASIGMSEGDIRQARDYGSEIHRSWRRVLQPLWMPAGVPSGEAGLSHDEGSDLFRQLLGGGLEEELLVAIRRFDWHSRVRIAFEEGEGGASWSRSERTITVRGDYVRRFVEQGKTAREE